MCGLVRSCNRPMCSEPFVERGKARLGIGGRYRQVQDNGVAYSLKESGIAYGGHSRSRMGTLSADDARSGD